MGAQDNREYRDYKIVFMGKSGTGKSSLINELFGLELPVDAVEECTKNLVATWIRNEDGRFDTNYETVMVMDTPGIAAALDNDEFYMPLYYHALEHADCVVWVAQGNTRSDRADQEMLMRLRPYFKNDTRLVICVNMVDKIGANYKKDWDQSINAPNEEMKRYIRERCDDFGRKLQEINVDYEAIVPCSALKTYHLDILMSKVQPDAPFMVSIEVPSEVADLFDRTIF